jgi:AcrR family transcriptional regulator
MAAPRRKSERGPAREPLSRERALRVAMALADRGGIDTLTMRKLAEELGVEAMSLYHHVPNKDAILDGMVDLVFAEIEAPARDVGWKDALRRRCESVRRVMLRHPWALRLMESRKTPGAATLAHHDAVLGCLRAGGFSLGLTAHAYALIDAYVYGFVLSELSLPFSTTEETHEVAGAIVEGMAEGAYPHLAELAMEHVMKPGYSFGDEFGYGLSLVLDGLSRAWAAERGGVRGAR